MKHIHVLYECWRFDIIWNLKDTSITYDNGLQQRSVSSSIWTWETEISSDDGSCSQNYSLLQLVDIKIFQ